MRGDMSAGGDTSGIIIYCDYQKLLLDKDFL